MPRIKIDLNPVTHITADAIGQPGQRVFYLQAWQGAQSVTLLIEKVQLQTLALGVTQFLEELSRRYPGLPPASPLYEEVAMHIQPPVEPLFRVGEMSLAYDPERDLARLEAYELVTDERSEEEISVVRLWCTRSQLLALAAWGLEVVNRGRPICPQCGEPMDPEGHFCPRRNGHKH
ncbi:DUF3090 domain-containing protein [uncultured Thermanaerothrix sp.]|uniref:DUF3090 domain-containing protein n=1 Tax=uncultured Thermanaerothrix sp. TaxID=1195149 RepID=UPI00261DA503|nr:DUF3090 domain-containing protein [uncultured Thermanaerothrix sp.]